MTDPRSHPTVRGWSLLLSSLTLTPDAGLEAYRARRAGDPALDLEQLTRARGILDAVAQAIASKDRARWQRLDRAFAVLERDTVVSLTEPTAAVDSPSNNPVPTSAPEPAAMPSPRAASHPPPPPVASPAPAVQGAQSPWLMARTPIALPPPATVAEGPHFAQSIDQTALGEELALGPDLPFVAHAGAASVASSPTTRPRSDAAVALPFQPARALAAPALSIQQLAAVAVDVELDPPSADAIRARYGLDAESALRAFAALEARCRSDAHVNAEWQQACALYRAHRGVGR